MNYFFTRTFSVILIALLSLFFQAQQASAVFVTDMAGRTVMVPEKVERIVTTFAPSTIFALCAGLGDRLVGTDNKAEKYGLFRAVMEGKELAKVGDRSSGINLETIVSLKPDLVLLYAQQDGKRVADKLESMGIASLIIYPESIADMKVILNMLAQATGSGKMVKNTIAAMDRMLAVAQERTEQLSLTQRARVYYAGPSGPLTTVSGEMLQDEMIRMAGAINVSQELEGFFQKVSPEQIVEWAPDVILYSRRLTEKRMALFSNKPFTALPAVREKRIYRFPSAMSPWDFPSPQSILGTLWIAKKVYPELFADVDMEKVTIDFYDTIFGSGFCTNTNCASGVR